MKLEWNTSIEAERLKITWASSIGGIVAVLALAAALLTVFLYFVRRIDFNGMTLTTISDTATAPLNAREQAATAETGPPAPAPMLGRPDQSSPSVDDLDLDSMTPCQALCERHGAEHGCIHECEFQLKSGGLALAEIRCLSWLRENPSIEAVERCRARR